MKPVAAAPLAEVNSKAVIALPAMSGTVQVVPAHRHINTLVPEQDIPAAAERLAAVNIKAVFVLLVMDGMVRAVWCNVTVLINILVVAQVMPVAQDRLVAVNIRAASVQTDTSGILPRVNRKMLV